jgi:hypothetical protein
MAAGRGREAADRRGAGFDGREMTAVAADATMQGSVAGRSTRLIGEGFEEELHDEERSDE